MSRPQLSALLLAAHHPAILEPLPAGATSRCWRALARRLPDLAKELPGKTVSLLG